MHNFSLILNLISNLNETYIFCIIMHHDNIEKIEKQKIQKNKKIERKNKKK